MDYIIKWREIRKWSENKDYIQMENIKEYNTV